ncbi:InlB B-repeat-containing protein, partial [Olsenella uli]|uniref:InlB B-repeat-containing protein n=1 Tax=Olsenella uli TaxID=133926 RepID=UPI0019567704
MDFRSKGKLAATAGLAAVLALSPVAAPVATALAADGNTETGVEAQDAETYTVTFIFGDDLNEDKVETYEAGKRVSRPTGYLATEGETIYGWYTDPELTNEYYFNTGIDQNLVLYAKWGESEHTVTYWNETSYDDMTDAVPYLVQTVEHGRTHPRPDDPPERDGYKFEAWYSDKECTQRYNFRAVEADTDVYAGWTKDPTVTYYLSPESKEPFYTVTVDLDLSPDEQRELLNKTAAFKHLDVEIPEDYEFDGFYTTPDYSGSKFTNWGGVREDTTLYVKFKQTPVVTYDFQLEGVEDQTAEVYFGDYADPMTYDDNEGYVIAGWYTDPECTEEYDFTEPVMGDMTLYAKWGVARYVTFDDGVDGNEDVVSTVANGEPVAKPADPVREGYDFAGWYTDEACTVAYDFAAPVE